MLYQHILLSPLDTYQEYVTVSKHFILDNHGLKTLNTRRLTFYIILIICLVIEYFFQFQNQANCPIKTQMHNLRLCTDSVIFFAMARRVPGIVNRKTVYHSYDNIWYSNFRWVTLLYYSVHIRDIANSCFVYYQIL